MPCADPPPACGLCARCMSCVVSPWGCQWNTRDHTCSDTNDTVTGPHVIKQRQVSHVMSLDFFEFPKIMVKNSAFIFKGPLPSPIRFVVRFSFWFGCVYTLRGASLSDNPEIVYQPPPACSWSADRNLQVSRFPQSAALISAPWLSVSLKWLPYFKM